MNINSLNAANGYGLAKQALRPDTATGAGGGASAGAGNSGFDPEKILGDLAGAVAQGDKASAEFMAGRADPHSVVEALASAELAVETAVTIRNRVVEAYQELLRMPI